MRVATAVGACVVVALVDTAHAQTVPSLLAPDDRVKDPERAACDVLKAQVRASLLAGKKPDQRWSCDFTSIASIYLRIVGLRSNGNLVGWYAVARRGHAVLTWDVGNWRLMAEGSSGPLVDDSPAVACEVAKARVAALLGAAPSALWRCDFDRPGDDFFYFVTLWGSSGRGGAAARLGTFAVARRSDLVVGFEESTNRVVPLRAN